METPLMINEVSEMGEYITSFSHINLRVIQNIPIRVSFEDGEYFIECEPLNLFSHGKTYNEAVQCFEEIFYILWEEYVLEDESALHESGIALRNTIKEYAEQM